MSLKQFTREIFERYGLTEEEIRAYLVYLRVPRATISEVFLTLSEEFEDSEIEYDKVEEISNKLAEKGFLKELPGVVKRYIPLEPYFELFTTESEGFRNEIGVIKEKVFSDQSDRFEKLETIQNDSIQEVESAVEAQIKDFFEDSDSKNAAKNERIETSKTRFTETNKTLEQELHAIMEEDYTRLSTDVNKNHEDVSNIVDANSNRFTSDNETLDNELSELTQNQVNSSKEQESKIHHVMDSLNSDLKSISEAFISDNESGINTAKNNITTIVSDLLEDFSGRVSDLELELKQQLDEHVSRHENIASELKPKMEQILEKYLERMDKIVVDLKNLISKLLDVHVNHVKITTEKLESDLKERLEDRQNLLKEQTTNFKNTTLTLIDNLLEHADRFTDFSEDMAKKGFFWAGKKPKYKARHETTIENILVYTEPMKEKFINESDKYIRDIEVTKNQLHDEIASVMSNEHNSLASETDRLDQEAQETLNAELESLASDMAGEIDDTLQGGIKDCGDTTLKLKDSLENSLNQHHKDYDTSINRHRDESLRHYTDFDTDIKRKNENWVRDVDTKFDGSKRDITAEIETQTRDLKNHLEKTNNKNVDHSKTFNTDVNELKSKQRTLYDELLNKVRTDFNASKSNISGKIDAEINLWNQESSDMDKNLNEMLENHKSKYEENAKNLQNSLSTTIRDDTQNTKDAIADFTLQFMNSIGDANEFAKTNEAKLKDIFTASAAITEISEISTWHTVGRASLIAAIKDAVYRVKSSIIIVMPIVVPEVLQIVSEFAFQRKAARFMLTSHWDLSAYGNIIEKMKSLGNIQFRQLSQPGEYYAVTRDAEEVILCPHTGVEKKMISIISNHAAYAKLYSSFIGPIFTANSRPIR